MRLLLLPLLFAMSLGAQSRALSLCDVQTPRHCMTIQAPTTLPANVTCTLGTADFGSCAALAGGAAGANTDVQVNNGGSLYGDATLTMASSVLSISNTTGITAGLNVRAYDPGTGYENRLSMSGTGFWSQTWKGTFGTTTGSIYLTAFRRGTVASPSAVQSGDVIAEYLQIGHDGTSSAQSSLFQSVVGSNWTTSNHETYLDFQAVPPSSTTLTDVFRMAGNLNTSYVAFSAESDLIAKATLKFYEAGAMQWQQQSLIANTLGWYNSSSVLRMYLVDNGAPPIGGTGANLVAPSVMAASTAANSPALMAVGYTSQTADLFSAYSVGMGTKYFSVGATGAVTFGTVTGSSHCLEVDSSGVLNSSVAGDCMTTTTNQTIGGIKQFTNGFNFSNGVVSYQVGMAGVAPYHLFITGPGGTPTILDMVGGALPTLTVPNLTLSGLTGSTQCLQVNSSGVVSATGLACGSGTYTAGTGISLTGGVIANTGVTSLSNSGLIGVSGATGAVTVSCTDCMSMSSNQTVTGVKNWQANQTFNADNTYSIGSTSAGAAVVYGAAINGKKIEISTGSSYSSFWNIQASIVPANSNYVTFNDTSSNTILLLSRQYLTITGDWARFDADVFPASSNARDLGYSGSPWRNLYVASGLYMNGTQIVDASRNASFAALSATSVGNLTVGSGNFYLRTFSGAPSCASVADGWVGYDTSGDHIYVCQGGTARVH